MNKSPNIIWFQHRVHVSRVGNSICFVKNFRPQPIFSVSKNFRQLLVRGEKIVMSSLLDKQIFILDTKQGFRKEGMIINMKLISIILYLKKLKTERIHQSHQYLTNVQCSSYRWLALKLYILHKILLCCKCIVNFNLWGYGGC